MKPVLSHRVLRALTVASLCLLALCVSLPAQTTVLGSDGELYSLQLGRAGDLVSEFPGDADASILALDVTGADGKSQRLVVPGSEDEDLEMSASMVFEPFSNSIYVIWASQYNFAHSRIRLIQFTDTEWSEPIDITDDPFTYKTAPMVAVTRENFTLSAKDGGLVTHERTILHTLWFEEQWEGDAVLYSPLILVDGQFVDRQSTLRLADFSSAQDTNGNTQRKLLISPAISAGDADHKVVATILDAATNRLINFEIEALALEITQLADDVREAIDVDASCSAGGLVALGNDARANIVTIARKRGFRGSMASTLATEARASILSYGNEVCDEPSSGIARRVGDSVIDAGAELSGGLFTSESDARANIVTIARKGGLDHRLLAREMTSRAAPNVEGKTRVFVSRDGKSNIVAWQTQDGSVLYVEGHSGSNDWSEPLELQLEGGLQSSETVQLLSRRLDG